MMNRIVANLDSAPSEALDDDRAGFGSMETERGRLPLVALDVQTRIVDLTAQTTVRQTFRNSLDEPLEATYIFPLPDRAAVTRFQMHVAGRTVDGVLKERGEAREEYDRAIEQGHRAAIAEEDRSGVFHLRVGNLPPREEVTVELTLVGPLPVADGEATFRFPLVVAPRYTPGVPLDGPSVGSGTAPDTDEVPDASRVTPPVLLPGFPNPVRLALEVQIDLPSSAAGRDDAASAVRCSLHSTITEGGSPWTIRLQPGERLNRDFILRFPVAGHAIGTSLGASAAADGKPGVAALTILPPSIDRLGRPAPRDVVFVLDRSGSMSGWKMVAARRAVGRMIDTLADQDHFGVLAFDDAIERPPHAKDSLMPGTNRQRWQTLEWLGAVASRGGTEMRPAITEAVRLLARGATGRRPSTPRGEPIPAPREQVLVIVTDGQVTGEDAILKYLAKETGGRPPRVFTVGIDRAVNAGFLRRLADFGGGGCELVESEERLDEAMDRIHRLIGTPVLTGVKIFPVGFAWLRGSLAPGRLPDLYADRPVTVYARHASAGDAIRVRIEATDANGAAWSDEVVARPAPADLLTAMWGRAKVRDLEDEYAAGRHRNATKLTGEIVRVSLESHVLSRFTAYVAIDEAEIVNQGGRQQQIVQPVEMPDGWAPDAVMGMLGLQCFAAAPSPSEKRRSLGRAKAPDAGEAAESLLCRLSEAEFDLTDAASTEAAESHEVFTRLLSFIIADAIQKRATEILIEPLKDRIQIQYRIEGGLVDLVPPPLHFLDRLVAVIRQLASLGPASSGQSQQGQFTFPLGGVDVELTVYITPTVHGEAVRLELAQQASGESTTQRRRGRFWT